MKYSILLVLMVCYIVSSCTYDKSQIQENEVSSKHLLKIGNSCGFDKQLIDKSIYSFESDNEAENAVNSIMKLTGLPSNFTIKASNVPNACAVIVNQTRYILYNQEFMERIKDESQNSYAELSILAR